MAKERLERQLETLTGANTEKGDYVKELEAQID